MKVIGQDIHQSSAQALILMRHAHARCGGSPAISRRSGGLALSPHCPSRAPSGSGRRGVTAMRVQRLWQQYGPQAQQNQGFLPSVWLSNADHAIFYSNHLQRLECGIHFCSSSSVIIPPENFATVVNDMDFARNLRVRGKTRQVLFE